MHQHAHIICHDVGFSYGPRTILHGITFSVAPGDRLGVVGANGIGKSTLLRLLADDLLPESGTISVNPRTATVGLLNQQLDDLPNETVDRFIGRQTGMHEIEVALEQAAADIATGGAGANDRYEQVLARYVEIDAATAEERIDQTLDRVGLGRPDIRALPTAALSGGQRTRLNLAVTLLASHDVLLLDEPTNDLDSGGLELLEEMLDAEQRALIIVSHDRAFLERTITSVLEIHDNSGTASRFNGGFAAWQNAREVARRQQYEAFEVFTQKRDNLKSQVQQQRQWSIRGVSRAKSDSRSGTEKDKFIKAARIASSEKTGGKAKQTERVLERFERDEAVERPWESWELRLEFARAERSGVEVAVLQQAVVALGDFRLGPIDLALTAGDRVVISGENGAGKSTLIAALLGKIELTNGNHHLGPSVKVATLGQQRDIFGGASTILDGFVDQTGVDAQTARSQLAKLGLTKEQALSAPESLSPGERTRAALGLFAAAGTNLLVLDEPTNHLDLPAIEQLELALEAFPHTVLLVTHDERLLENVTTNRSWHVAEGQLKET